MRTQLEVAKEVGVAASSISRIEAGDRPSADTLVRLMRSLDFGIDDIPTKSKSAGDRRTA